MATSTVGRTTIQGATTVGGFNPLTLFTSGEQGVWYDPSDLSTMYQDSAGTIPITALEQPVGRINDKSGRGNNATQATSGSRPVLSARVNLLTYTEDFTNAIWIKRGFGTPASGQTDPFGGSTAWSITENNTNNNPALIYDSAINDTVSRTVSVWLKASTNVSINLSTQGATSPGNINVTTSWQLFSVTQSIAATSVQGGPHIGGFSTITRGSGIIIYVWHSDLRATNQGFGLPPYQRVGAATYGTSTTAGNADYDANGFPYYLSFDGSNDSLATGNINFSSTNKMGVWTGVRKLSAAVLYPAICELSSVYNSNSGSFAIFATGSSTDRYAVGLNGSTANRYEPQTFALPITNTISASYDIAGATLSDQIIPRVNGVVNQSNSSGSNAGTGNFGNYPLYIGARGGSSLYFTGNLYGLIVRGASSTANQITGAENWLNQKTAAY